MRGGSVFWNFESYNPPISRDNWANKDSLEERADRLCHKSTYLQAPPEWLGEQFLAEAEHLKETDERAYQHEYLGIPVGTGGNVFENLELREITDEEVSSFDRIYNGVDWGYFPDPWAFNRCFYDAARRTLYIFAEMTANKKRNKETADMLIDYGLTREDLITADGAEPKSVADYQKFGLRCISARKGPGSIERSMQWLQGLSSIVIDKVKCPKRQKNLFPMSMKGTARERSSAVIPTRITTILMRADMRRNRYGGCRVKRARAIIPHFGTDRTVSGYQNIQRPRGGR